MRHLFFSASLLLVLFFFVPALSLAQIMGTDRENIFEEDNDKVKEARDKQYEEKLKVDGLPSEELQFNSPTIEYDKNTNELKGSGGVILSRAGTQLQCDTAYYNQETKDVRVEGQLLYSWPQGRISAQQGDLSLKTETGEFSGSEVVLDDSLFRIKSEKLFKDSETEYRMYDAGFSSCDCKDGGWPWSIDCDKARMEEEGYAHTYNTTLKLYDIPIFYSPYLFFPVKKERQSGLLAPTYGYSSQDGVQYRQPIFLVLNEHSDVNVSPFVETDTRYGSQFDLRAAFSKYHQSETKFLYSDDTWRNGDLRGTNVDGLFDPTFDDQRYGVYHKQLWRTESGFDFPTTFVADI
ncbi:MAG: LPS-assembly protein LptD, partial [Bdellovibrionales bacterium]|nr:LPS-assembly protein LptD [Bdellovibrionales bacterium]